MIIEDKYREETRMKILMAESHLWDSPYQVGSHKYAALFARDGHQVFWLSPQRNLFGLLKHSLICDEKSVLRSYKIWKYGGIKVQDKIAIYSPMTLLPYRNSPVLSSKTVAKLSWKFTAPSLRRILRQWQFDSVDVIWLTEPASYYLVHLIPHRVLIHRVFDDLNGHKNVSKTTLLLQRQLIKMADVVFVTAQNLIEHVERIRRKSIYFLPNGVDFEHFAKQTSLPYEYEKIPPPRIIYVGAIREWFDVKLLANAARSLPQYSFILIGDILIDISLIKELPNVFFLGPRDFSEIPAYIQHCQVGIIPFKVNRLTNSIHPIKLYEYFACGLPVVSVKLDEISNIESPTVLASTYCEFIEALQYTVSSFSPEVSVRCQEFAKRNTWADRYLIIREFLKELT